MSTTLESYVRLWLPRFQRTARPSTFRAYAGDLRRHVLPTLGAVLLEEIATPVLRRLFGDLLATLQPRSVRRVAAATSAALEHAHRDGLVEHNACIGALRKLVPFVRSDEPRFLSPDVLAHFLGVAHARAPAFAPAWLVQARCGLRIGELLTLQPGDVRDRLCVARTLIQAPDVTGPTKGGRVRYVDLSPQARQALETLQRRAVHGPWLCSTDGRRPWPVSTVAAAFKATLVAAGLPTTYRPHSLRHSFAVHLLAHTDAKATYVRDQMGHRSITVTCDIYAPFLGERRPELVAELDTLAHAPRHPPRPAAVVRRLRLVKG